MEVNVKRGGTPTCRTFQMKLQGEMLYQLERYAEDIKLSPGEAIKHLVESELVRKRYLPDWWYTRGRGR